MTAKPSVLTKLYHDVSLTNRFKTFAVKAVTQAEQVRYSTRYFYSELFILISFILLDQRVPYPAPFIMNPYPNGSTPYPQQGPPYSPQSANGPSTGPGIPGHPHYPYPMHSPYAPHPGYAPYTQYPPQMLMYGPPRPTPTGQQATPPVHPPPPVTGKRKRKSITDVTKSAEKTSDDEAGPSGSDSRPKNTLHSTPQTIADTKKRTKTQRACDSCRSRKIRYFAFLFFFFLRIQLLPFRCDILLDADPPLCQHCKQYGFECTFFLPIAETRFKKKKVEEEAAEKDKDRPESSTSALHVDTHSKSDVKVFGEIFHLVFKLSKISSNLTGPTSATHLLHSQATINSRIYESYDLRYHHVWEVSKTGDGLIHVEKPTNPDHNRTLSRPVDIRIERDAIEELINAYFADIAPMLPVITQAEFVANPSPPPILLYSMCLVAAARRGVPQNVFDSIRYTVNNIIKVDDVLSTASLVNVQALLILCMVGDCHSQFVPNALSALWIRLGTAIRMVRDWQHQWVPWLLDGYLFRHRILVYIAQRPSHRILRSGDESGPRVSLATGGPFLTCLRCPSL